MDELLRNAVGKALIELGAPSTSFVIEWPTDAANGDYSTNAALAASKALGKNPREVAEALVAVLRASLPDDIEKIDIAGPGFINFTLASKSVSKTIGEAVKKGVEWGRSKELEDRKIMVEYSNPNPFKEIHIGHLMSNVVGEAISRIIENAGANVLRDTFGGDVGPHVAKALWALKKNGVHEIADASVIGKAYVQGSNAYEESAEVKEEIDSLNTHIYQIVEKQTETSDLSPEDSELLSLWLRGREISMGEFSRIFKLLGTTFDYTFFDSDTTKVGIEKVREGVEKGIFEESEGAIIYRGEKKGLHTLVFITSRGNPTYETKDIGLAFLKEERIATDTNIIITAIEQVDHFKIVLAALEEIAPVLAEKTEHIPHGLLRLIGGKMSSRKGNIITAAELIEEIIEKAKEKNEDPLIAEQVAIGAIKYMILRGAPGGDIIFDPEKSLSLDGDSGPYLQYALVRARKILSYDNENAAGDIIPETPYAIERLIIHFPEVCKDAYEDRAPQKIVSYLTRLAGAWNAFYATEQVLGSPEEAYKQRLAKAFATTMENGLRILAIPAPDRM